MSAPAFDPSAIPRSLDLAVEDVIDVLLAAVELEKTAVLYYQGLLDAAGGAHQDLEIILAEEKAHLVKMTKMLEENLFQTAAGPG